MVQIRPLKTIRPKEELADRIAALPYDVYNGKEARRIVEKNPLSFLRIDRPEILFSEKQDQYAPEIYESAAKNLWEMREKGQFIQEEKACFYLYELTWNGRRQRGLVCCVSIDDYVSGEIRRHEDTRAEKEGDRVRHITACSAHTGPIFLIHRFHKEVKDRMEEVVRKKQIYDFVGEDKVRHQVWKIEEDEQIETLISMFAQIRPLYIADGHHRAAAAVQVGLKRRTDASKYDGKEEFNYFLSVLFDETELQIMDYNRVIPVVAEETQKHLLEKISPYFEIHVCGETVGKPKKKGEIGMYFQKRWYLLEVKKEIRKEEVVAGLDVSVLQDYILEPIFGIKNPRTDPSLQFVGGIRGLRELEKIAAKEESAVAFAMYPTSMEELLAVAEEGKLMPPKSTWFEPKLRSGLFIHEF